MSNSFLIRFDGLDAENHLVDMRRVGEAFVGLDRIVNFGMVALSDYRMPKQRERFPLQLRAQEPRPGSWEIYGQFAPFIAVGLPIVHELFNTAAGEIAWRWISWVLSMAGGRQPEADKHFTQLMELSREIHRGRIESEEQNRQFLLAVLDRVLPAARQAVSPVGPSAETLTLEAGDEERLSSTIDTPMADAIRSGQQLEVGDMETFRVRVDGLIHHNRQLRVELPDDPGRFISADVRDPAFAQADNVYTRAVAAKGWLVVSAKPTRKTDGSLHRLYIMDAKEGSGDDTQEGNQRG